MFERLLLAAAAIAFAWSAPTLTHTLRRIEPHQLAARLAAAVERHVGGDGVSRMGCGQRDPRAG